MSILLDRNSRLIVQGITGREGGLHARLCKEYGTNLVGGVTPGRGGGTAEGVPVFDTVAQAVRETGANASLIFVPAPFAMDAILESADAGIPLVVCITEGLPTMDMIGVRAYLSKQKCTLIGPNCPGLITPGQAKAGIMPGDIYMPGNVGIISRSGTLTYEAAYQLTQRGIGQSTCVGIGGDPIIGTTFVEALELFNEDAQTEALVLIGEIGGSAEEEASAYIKANVRKPVIGFIAGRTAPPGRRMGHAGAIISGGSGSAADKMAALESAGATIAQSPADIGETVQRVLSQRVLSRN